MSNRIPLAILAAGFIVAVSVYLTVRPQPAAVAAAQNLSLITPIQEGDHMRGNPTAPIEIIEYSDFECPHCASFHATLAQAVADFGAKGQVVWVVRNFALTELHKTAKRDAEAAECVAKSKDTDAYFSFVTMLFQNMPVDPLRYSEFAKKAGANPDAVASCIQNAATNGVDARIDADRTNALAIGAQGTPYTVLIINGQPPVAIEGTISYADLKDRLQAALAAVR